MEAVKLIDIYVLLMTFILPKQIKNETDRQISVINYFRIVLEERVNMNS